jgi:hypothetical protein
MTLTQQLSELRKLGWTCEHPDYRHPVQGLDKVSRQCVWIEGPVFGYDQTIGAYLSATDDCVMICGIMSRDLRYAEFIRWITEGDSVVEKAKPDARQKSLF